MIKDLVINGDSLVELKRIPDNSIDLIFADPPYWMRTTGTLKRVEGTDYDGVKDDWDKFESLDEYTDFTKQWLLECHRVLKKDGSIWVIGGMQCIYTIGSIMLEIGYWFINDVIWHKSNPTPNFLGTRLNNSHETLIWATKGPKSKYHFNYKTAKELNREVEKLNLLKEPQKPKQLGSIWKMPVSSGNERLRDNNGNKLHSTQKPEELLYKIIAISSQIGDLVLDPFGGTMTTAAVAKKMGRHFIAIEKEKKYCDYGLERIEKTNTFVGDIENALFDVKPIKASMLVISFLFKNWKKKQF
jgi:site-specific DNA-methyltransferase (adenine-specific)